MRKRDIKVGQEYAVRVRSNPSDPKSPYMTIHAEAVETTPAVLVKSVDGDKEFHVPPRNVLKPWQVFLQEFIERTEGWAASPELGESAAEAL